MKKLIKEWKKFINESVETTLQVEIDLEKDEIILYHVGWMRPDEPFKIAPEHMFTGEPKTHSNMKRPLGNEAIYFSTSKAGAERYKKYSSFSFLHTVKIPISKLAGSLRESNIQNILKSGLTASEEDFVAFAKQCMENYKTDYKAEFDYLGTSLEVGVLDTSIIERVEATPLFTEADLSKHFDKVFAHFNRTMKASKNEEGKFMIKTYFGDKLVDSDYMIRRIDDVIGRYSYAPKKLSEIETFKYYFPGKWEELMQRVEEFKQSLGGS